MMIINRKPRNKADFAWTQWTVHDIDQAVEKYINNLGRNVERFLKVPKGERTFENTVWAYEMIDEPYQDVPNFLSMLVHCSPDAKIRSTAERAQNRLQTESMNILFSKKIYYTYRSYVPPKNLPSDALKVYRDTLRSFIRGGFDLPDREYERLKKNYQTMNKLAMDFDVSIARYSATITITQEQAECLPEEYRKTLKMKKGVYVIGTSQPEAGPFLSYMTDPVLRKKMVNLISQRGGQKNLTLLKKLIALRKENAHMLGFSSYAEYVLEDRMAKNIRNVEKLYETITEPIREAARTDLADLQIFRDAYEGKKKKLEFFDIPYYSRMLKEELYHLDPEEIRSYFPLSKVLDEILRLTSHFFGVTFKKCSWPAWHDDVVLYEVLEKKKDGKNTIGYIALDLFPREGKYNHAMAHDMHHAGLTSWQGNTYRVPTTAIVANFRSSTKGAETYLSLGEIETFFHEWGHVLHNTFATSSYSSQAGYHTKTDFVELPSQLFEQWLWHPTTLKNMSAHRETGFALSKNTIQAILDSQYYMEGQHLARQIALGQFDLDIHARDTTTSFPDRWNVLMKKYQGFSLPKDSLFPADFGHMAHGYAVGYYSYLWTLVYAHDCFSLFEKQGVFSSSLGKRYKKEILSMGSSREEMASLKAFLGRNPSSRAFIHHIKKNL